MHNTVISLEDITLQDLLTVDTHGEIINIQDRFAAVPYELISNRQIFFNEVFAEVENNGLCRVLDERKKEIDLTEFLDTLEKSKDSTVTLIEGFAGCGKSTLVQYILWNQLKTPNYDYYFYNYDLEAQNDIMIHDESGNVIRKSSIFEAIKKSYVEQFVHMVEMNKEIVKDIRLLLEKCEYFQPFNSLYYDLYNTDTFMEILKLIDDSAVENNIIARNLFLQLGKITSSRNLLALDCILRLSMYNHKIIEKLYICYDNLDAIEDAEDLKNFDDVLIGFRGVIDRFIVYLQKGNYFRGVVPPHFNFIATYRKITAVIAKIADTAYREVMIDKNTEVDIDKVIFHIDATSAFSYKRIVNRRKDYFERYFKSALNISKETKKKLLADFASWDRLNQTLEIMNDRYACLWNKNYRTCSVIAGKLYSDSDYEFSQNVDFIEDSKVHDGYDHSEDEDGNSILCSYYGGSAILLSSVCKVFNKNEVWDDLLNLAPLNADEHSYKNVSFSRIILTYLYNKDEAVSLRELFTVFCGNELYDYTELCHILAKMLARNPKGVWRRPIYYSGEYILSEKSDEIERELGDICKKLKDYGKYDKDYSFQLCDSGRAYVERLMQEFEFFSNRISNSNKALYLYNDIDSISRIIEQVFQAVSSCCDNMKDFREQYMRRNNISDEKYLKLLIHPVTNKTHSPQLHTERTIFSHIAYLNNVRLYFLDCNVTKDLEYQKEYNKVFVEFIRRYIDLYINKIQPLTSKRSTIAMKLKSIVDKIQEAINTDNNDKNVLFQSISLG